MGRLPSKRAVALRESLVTAMARAEEPLSTNELREVPPDELLPWRAGPDVYNQLRALERLGVCRRAYVPDVARVMVDPKNVYWVYTQDEAFAAVVADLEAGEDDGASAAAGRR